VGAALTDFETTLGQAEALIQREARFQDPPRPQSTRLVLGLRGGATVLMVAAFERFLREMFVEKLDPLTADPPPVAFDDLPDRLRISSVFNSLERATRGPLHGRPPGKLNRLPDVRRSAGLIVLGRIDADALSDTGSNPNSETVKSLFKDVDCSDVFVRIRTSFEASWGRAEAETFVPDKLDEVVNSRHRVAHRADALNISRAQLAEWPRFLRVLSETLDVELEQHVTSLLPP
jgi:RiboL-PSP-HEPN